MAAFGTAEKDIATEENGQKLSDVSVRAVRIKNNVVGLSAALGLDTG